jgi:hypothetical protein
MPHLLKYGVPNEFFPDGFLPDGKVQYDAGMSGGCSWKPFEMLLSGLSAMGPMKFRFSVLILMPNDLLVQPWNKFLHALLIPGIA